MVVGICHLQGWQPLPWRRSPVSFGQISLGVVFQWKSWDKGPSSLALPRMVHHPWPVAPDVIWHIYSHLYCSSRDGGRDLPSSVEVAPTMGQVPCEFRADWPTFIFQLVTPDVIWHIYSHLYCSSRDGGRDLLSSGRAAPIIGKVPCEFQADWPGCSFSREELRQGSFQPCPAQDDASSMAGGSEHDLAHLLTPVLLIKDGGRDSPSSGEAAPTMGQVPCKFQADQPSFIFQPVTPDVIWHIYSHLYCSSRDGGRDLLSSGRATPTMGKVPCEFRADQPGCSFSREELRQKKALPCPGWCIIHGRWLWTWFGTFTHTCTAHQGMVVGTCHLQGRQPLPWGRSPVSFKQIGQPSFFSWWLLT